MRVMVDMSVNLLHHGHIRLLKKGSELGHVVVGLTSDEEILEHKGYKPELTFSERKEILDAISYVDEVVKTPWLITQDVLDENNIDALLHGHDNCNDIDPARLAIVPRTEGVSTTELRERAITSLVFVKNRKAIFTPGPGALLPENLLGLEPCFGRGDEAYLEIEDRVLARLRQLSGHDNIVRLQGSASLALEISIRNFLLGRVLVVTTGYYADRLVSLCKAARAATGNINQLDVVGVDEIDNITSSYDWVVTVYTETSIGFKNDIVSMRKLAEKCGAHLMVDATGSIGLEEQHDLADVIAYSSCKGLFGLTGAAFIAFNGSPQVEEQSFYLNLQSHAEKKMTGPYHAIYSLDQSLTRTDDLKASVRANKKVFCQSNAGRLVHPQTNEPLLCTLIRGSIHAMDENVVLYEPRTAKKGTSILCHLGEGHLGRAATGNILKRISVVD